MVRPSASSLLVTSTSLVSPLTGSVGLQSKVASRSPQGRLKVASRSPQGRLQVASRSPPGRLWPPQEVKGAPPLLTIELSCCFPGRASVSLQVTGSLTKSTLI
ncbi:hypothetical protein EYF80_064201 [Liparis tanakae]|uniref:Uncharacterized protein n=1 Tax=Liparis tanakae TaxID=230148 RepID=A0A4Z2EA12_9TELE|nr:hypothetical protein EYF80_064201 [Liparis tanakae]